MGSERRVGKMLIPIAAAVWVVWALRTDFRLQIGMSRDGQQMLVAAAGLIVAWVIWRRLYPDATASTYDRDRARDERLLSGDPRLGLPPVPGSPAVLGPCPACGSPGPPQPIRAPDGTEQVRCPECGLVGTPPGKRAQTRPPA